MTNSNDPFEKYFQEWYRGVQLDAQAQREQKNVNDLIQRLVSDGHAVVQDYTRGVIVVDKDTPVYMEISMQVAREMEPGALIDWVNGMQRRHSWTVYAVKQDGMLYRIASTSDIKDLYARVGHLAVSGATEIRIDLDNAPYTRYSREEYYPADKQTNESQEGSNNGE